MILHLIAGGTENHPVYQELQVSNVGRQCDFLLSAISASLDRASKSKEKSNGHGCADRLSDKRSIDKEGGTAQNACIAPVVRACIGAG